MKPTKQEVNGTSFHGSTVYTTVNELTKVCGEPVYNGNTGDDKVNFEWYMENSKGDVFTIYDWKEYRSLNLDEPIEFHIGSHTRTASNKAYSELLNELQKHEF
jgi:hypothetical protein